MPLSNHRHLRSGFTLLEVSIILVAVGLLTGGILAAQSLIHTSKLNAVTKQYLGYTTVIRAFKDKYLALPGDISNATQFWGTAAGTGSDSTCRDFSSTGTPTCNGDADGVVLNITGSPWESFRFWQHLSNAGLINGNYTGKTNGSSTAARAGVGNSPAGKLGGVWYADSDPEGSGCTICGSHPPPGAVFSIQPLRNFLMYGAIHSSGASMPNWPLLKPEELWNIDTKIDDGKPGTGKIVVFCGSTMTGLTDCTTATVPTDVNATYLLTPSANTAPLAVAIFNEAY